MRDPVPEHVDDCARSVHRGVHRVRWHLGAGLRESTYKAALEVDLRRRGHHVVREAEYEVVYDGVVCGKGAADFLVDDCLVVEAKAVEALHAAHFAQTLTYVHGLGKPLGLLVNFNAVPLWTGIKRVVAHPSSPKMGSMGFRGVLGEPGLVQGPDHRRT